MSGRKGVPKKLVTKIEYPYELISKLPVVGNSQNLTLKTSNIQNSGRGLFALEDIPKERFITRYDGFFIKKDGTDSSGIKIVNIEKSTYITEIEGYYFVGDMFPTYGHGLGSFCNDNTITRYEDLITGKLDYDDAEAKSGNVANAKITLIDVKKMDDYSVGKIMVIESLIDIKAGEEIYIEYGKSYWNTVSSNTEKRSQSKFPFLRF